MSQTRQRPTTRPDDDSKPTCGIHVVQGGRPATLGLFLVILYAVFQVSIGCATDAGRLFDMERRTINYKSVIGEPLVTDYKITEGWYSLDQYRIVQGVGNLTAGLCGTRYQIAIQEGSTIDWDTLDENPVTLTASVYGRPDGHGEELEIRVRKCDHGLQYYLKPPSIRLAAYCFDSMDTDPVADEEGPLNIQGSIYVNLQGSLNFREELRDGQLYDVPYATLTCYVNDHGLGDIFPEIQFITITWFVDNARIKSTGPQSFSNRTYDNYGNVYSTSSNLTEDEFLAAGFSLGATIRCGAQLSENVSGKLSSMITTSYDTSLQFYASGTEKTDDNDKLALSVYSPVPLGCAAPVGTVEENCAIKLRLIRDDGSLVCSDGPNETDEHELCGITLFGRTKNGTDGQYRYYTNENGTNVYEYHVVYIQLESTLDDVEKPNHVYFSLAVIENTAGHALWNNVNIRNVKVDLPEMWTEDHGYHYFDISPDYPPRIAINDWNQRDGTSIDHQITIEEAGKYIMLRSGRFPFTVNFKEVGLTYNAYLDGSQLHMYFYTNPGFDPESIEGVFSFGNGEMVGRHGNVFTNGSAGFLQSWRIGESESLSNPDNHIFYSLESKYTTCVCPTKTIDIPERETTYASNDYIHYNVYTGALYCNLDEVCSDVTLGEDWPTTLRPDYLIEEVRIGCEQRVDDAGEPLLWFTCQFNSVQDMLYTATWYIDSVLFKRIETATSDTEFGLNEAEIGEDFVFDMKIQCSVSVSDGNMNELISPIMSEVFEPIRFSSTNIDIQRGGDGTLTWISNIPFLCHGDYTDCHMELQLFDPNDTYDCVDSTVAFKAENDCGGRVQATKTVPASTGNDNTVIVTTKNNLDYGLKTYFELRAMVIFHGAGRSTWTHLLRTVFIVMVVDELLWTGMDCHLHVDPHARSADGRYYEMQYIGMFVLARHLILPIQVQVITMSCWESSGYWSPTCACALVFQAGLDIYLLDRCNGARFSGFLLAEDGVLDVYEEVDNRYKVIFPNTMMVEVRIMPYFNYFMNVDIYPSPNEQRNLVGLCGNFNGDTNDDFQLRDAADQGSTEDFSMSWELHETGQVEAESLLEEKNYMNPTPWSSEQRLCVCPNARDATNTPSSPLCSANEENTCTIPKDHKGKKLDHSQRPKRDTGEYVNLDVARRVSRLRRGIAEQHAIHRKRRSTLSNPNRMNETEARTICEEKFAKSPINNLTAKLIPEDQFLKDCTFDVQESGSAEWAQPQVIAFTSRNEAAIKRNTSFTNEYPEGYHSWAETQFPIISKTNALTEFQMPLTSDIKVVAAMGQICSHECYGHGTCLGNDECQCDSGWGRQSCILNLTIGPIISFITGDGLCDRSIVDCSAFVFETDGLNETFYGKVTELEADNDGKFHIKHEFTFVGESHSYNEGVIDLTSGRRRRSTSSDPVLATQYGVSISNDGINYGNVTYVTVLDTSCQETTNNSDGDIVVALMAGYCYIDGVCYSEGNSSVDNSCKICRTAESLFDWTDDNCPTTATPSHDDGLPLYVIIFSATGGVVVIFIIVGGILFFRHTQKRRPVTPLPPPPPYPGPAPVGPMNLRFYLKGVERESLDQYERPAWRY